MSKHAAGPLITLLHLDRSLSIPLHRQLYEELRNAILTERLHPGERLPSTRTLASELGLSRRTVLDGFLQLFAEGYIEGRTGAGTYVAVALPDQLLQLSHLSAKLDASTVISAAPQLSERFYSQQAVVPYGMADYSPLESGRRAFTIGMPALDMFPMALWRRLATRIGRNLGQEALVRDKYAGFRPLRDAIAGYLAAARGVRCSADQVIIVNGSQQALSLIANILLNPGDPVWVEDPGYFGVRGALLAAGGRLIPVPVDGEGMNVEAGNAMCSSAKLAFVTPSHQMPLGVTMSLPRRLALLDWARTAGRWVVEDDYDSEFRYASRPLAALYGLDSAGRVIYTGTFSKVLFPGLRIGYMVVPSELVGPILTARLFADMYTPLLEQLLVTEFIQQGHFERHVRRMRGLYAERQATLVDSSRAELHGMMEVAPAESGMHLLGRLPDDVDDREVSALASENGVRALALSRQYIGTRKQMGLLLGYAAAPNSEIIDGVRVLAKALLSAKLKAFNG